MSGNGDDPIKWLEELFGPVIFSYPDSQAVEDGVLIPFLTPNGRDTRHRMTNNAFDGLQEHYKKKGYADYTQDKFYWFFFNEFLCLAPYAVKEYNNGGVLTTDYDFKVRKFEAGKPEQLWYMPNEVGGVTMMRPDDY